MPGMACGIGFAMPEQSDATMPSPVTESMYPLGVAIFMSSASATRKIAKRRWSRM